MELKSCPLLSAVLLILVASSHYQVSAAVSRSAIVGGWKPIKDLNSRHVLEIAIFALSENNKKAGAKLQFVKMVTGTEGQYVGGMYYKLVITANDAAIGNTPGNYEAQVWDMPWAHLRQLKSFMIVQG